MVDENQLKAFLGMIFGIAIIITAIIVAFGAKKAKMADTANTTMNTIVAIMLFAIGSGAIAYATFGKSALDTIGLG